MRKRYSGVLVHLTSLPGPYGVGTFGPETLQFGKRLREAGFSYWQVLPFTLVDEFHSPYKTVSAFAGNPMFIDPRHLVADGLLTQAEVDQLRCPSAPDVADYAFAFENSDKALRLAFTRVTPALERFIHAFVEKERYWLEDYACFSVANALYKPKPWWEWPDRQLAQHKPEAVARFMKKHDSEIRLRYFKQWVFMRQWGSLRGQLHREGLGVIGDVPFYVDQNSADVWAHRELFEMEGMKFERVAGVPPDYFSKDGQLWGNPVYNWEAHKAEGYAWWKARLARALDKFDRVRIDHFRALVNYWAVPAGEKTAVEGCWEEGPFRDFYHEVLDQLDKKRLFVEDLGAIEPEVREGIEEAGLPVMKVLQFALDPHTDGADLPHNFSYDMVAYTGTHDNTTSLGWIWEITPQQREYALRYLNFPKNEDWGKGGSQSPFCRCLIRQLWMSVAQIAVTPIQDLCGFGGDTRMNVPGRAKDNWGYRLPKGSLEQVDWGYYKDLNRLYQRDTAAAESEHKCP